MFWFEGRGLGLPVSVGELSLRVGTHLVLLTQMPELAYTPPSTGKRASSEPHTVTVNPEHAGVNQLPDAI